jgi:intron-binding protein aquarius
LLAQRQRTVIMTHSNQGLDQIVARVAALGVDPLDLVRLGGGARNDDEDPSDPSLADYSRQGRLAHAERVRQAALAVVAALAAVLGHAPSVAQSCETALYYWRAIAGPFTAQSAADAAAAADAADAAAATAAPADAGQEPPSSLAQLQAFATARGHAAVDAALDEIRTAFADLEWLAPLEVLRGDRERGDYLVTAMSRIVAMTTTHAAIKRAELVSLGFSYDTLVMEEAGQVLDVESFLALSMQAPGAQRLQRATLIGDHRQLPPVIQCRPLQAHARLDQSMFARLARLAVPHVTLRWQGRCRPELAALFGWRYGAGLRDLPLVAGEPPFTLCTPGFAFPAQFIDVGDWNGRGETEPSPHSFQNVGEAEYAVALFMYMRMIGYPASRIALLCGYRAQVALVRDVLRTRTSWTPFFGTPGRVTTIDRFQGSQADIAIVSLVRTRAPGHLADPRRITVAVSRARLGLFVLGRREVFVRCAPVAPALGALAAAAPARLVLNTREPYGATRARDAPAENPFEVAHTGHMMEVVQFMLGQQGQQQQNHHHNQQQQQGQQQGQQHGQQRNQGHNQGQNRGRGRGRGRGGRGRGGRGRG